MSSYIEELAERPTRAIAALEKGKYVETKRISEGFKYIQVTPRETILVECDENGQPNAKGLERIKRFMKRNS